MDDAPRPWRLGLLIESEDDPLLSSNPMQILRLTEGRSGVGDQQSYCMSVCRQASIGTFRFSNEYNSVQNVGDNVGSVDSSLLRFPTVVKLAAVDQPADPVNPVRVEPVHVGLVHPQTPDVLLTSPALVHSLNCFNREAVWYRPSTSPVVLQTVILGLQSEHSYEEARRIVSRLYQLSKTRPLILQQGFDFTVGFDDGAPPLSVSVLETFPTLQGRVSDKTTVSVLNNVPLKLDPVEVRPRAQSASNYDLEGPSDYSTEVITTSKFPLQNHFIVLPKNAAQRHSIQHCQNVWISPFISSTRTYAPSERKASVIELDARERMHMAIALLYEDEQQLERYLPPHQFGQRHLTASLGLAYIHPELLYYLFPETISPTRTFRISVKVNIIIL